jgi:hypothetical protein
MCRRKVAVETSEACACGARRGSARPICAPISTLGDLMRLPDLDVGRWEVRAHVPDHCDPHHQTCRCNDRYHQQDGFRLVDIFLCMALLDNIIKKVVCIILMHGSSFKKTKPSQEPCFMHASCFVLPSSHLF